MTVQTIPWRDLIPAPHVTVARVGGRTIIGSPYAIWDAEGLRPHVPAVPVVDGRYEIRGRRLAPDTTPGWMPTGQALHDALEAARGRDDVPVTVTDWAYQGQRVITTPTGQVRSIPEAVADLAIGLLDLRAAADPRAPISAYRYIDGEPTLVGLVQGYSGYRDDPVMAAIAARSDYYAAV